jgi:hypothetical protein
LADNVYAGLNAVTGARALIAREGDTTLLSPQWTSNVTLTYEHALVDQYSGYIRADLQHSSAFRRTTSAGTVSYDPALYAGPAYSFLTLRSGLVHGTLDLAFFVDNVTNTRPALYASYGLDSISRQIQQQTTLRPRTFGIDAGYRF